MITTFTQNDVLRYIYDELSNEKRREIEISLVTDNDLMEFYIEALETVGFLKTAFKEPSAKSIENIINYSRTSISSSL